MKNIIFIFLLTTTFCFGQNDRFNLGDSASIWGTDNGPRGKYITWQIKYSNIEAEIYEPESTIVIDSVCLFMKRSPTICIEIQDHRQKNSSIQHSLQSAKNIMARLVRMGISSSRLSAKGFGGTKPYIHDSIMKKAKSKKIAEVWRLKNCRTIFIINDECYSKETFRESKSVADVMLECGKDVNLRAIVKGELRETHFEGKLWSNEARNILDSADIGSKIYINCLCRVPFSPNWETCTSHGWRVVP